MVTIHTQAAYDIVVAGGGPAGLSAAQVAAAQGLRVLLIEKHAEIGSPTRTSGGSFIADLVALGVPPHLYHPVHHCHVFGPSTRATFSYKESPRNNFPPLSGKAAMSLRPKTGSNCLTSPKHSIGCVVNVRSLYQYLAEQAVSSGAELRVQSQVLNLVRDGGAVRGVTVRDSAGKVTSISCALVIDATGFSSTLAVKAGIHASYRRAGVGAEYDLYAPHFPEDMAALAVGNGIAPAGYAWAFPYGNHRVRAGVGVLRPDVAADPADFLDDFIRSYEPLREAFIGASPIERHTGVIPGEGTTTRFVTDGLMTTGDSAGQASSLFGEGIRYAMYAGRVAGQVGARAVRQDCVSAAALAPYEHEWRRRFGRSHQLAYVVNRILYGSTDAEWDSAVRALQGCGSGQFARLLASDLSIGLGFRIAMRNPRALGTAAQLLMRARARNTRIAAVAR